MSEQTQTDAAALQEKIQAALREVHDPELGMNVVELGLVRKVDIQADLIEITMIMTTPFCPIAPQLLEQARYHVEKAVNLPVRVELGAEMWEPSMMEGGAPSDWGL